MENKLIINTKKTQIIGDNMPLVKKGTFKRITPKVFPVSREEIARQQRAFPNLTTNKIVDNLRKGKREAKIGLLEAKLAQNKKRRATQALFKNPDLLKEVKHPIKKMQKERSKKARRLLKLRAKIKSKKRKIN